MFSEISTKCIDKTQARSTRSLYANFSHPNFLCVRLSLFKSLVFFVFFVWYCWFTYNNENVFLTFHPISKKKVLKNRQKPMFVWLFVGWLLKVCRAKITRTKLVATTTSKNKIIFFMKTKTQITIADKHIMHVENKEKSATIGRRDKRNEKNE